MLTPIRRINIVMWNICAWNPSNVDKSVHRSNHYCLSVNKPCTIVSLVAHYTFVSVNGRDTQTLVGGRAVRRCWRPTFLITVGQGPTALAVGAGGGCLDIVTPIYPFFPLSPSLWKTARYRLKYCLKELLNPKQPKPTNSNFKQIKIHPVGIWCQNDVVSTSMRRHYIISLHIIAL